MRMQMHYSTVSEVNGLILVVVVPKIEKILDDLDLRSHWFVFHFSDFTTQAANNCKLPSVDDL